MSVATDLLVENLQRSSTRGRRTGDNYRAHVGGMDPATALSNMLTGIATLTGFEMASERLATALDSGSQEDEQSCFSDNTHVDILANATGVANVYFGRYGDWQGAGLNARARGQSRSRPATWSKQIETTVALARRCDHPFDRTLASPPGSPERQSEALVHVAANAGGPAQAGGSALGVPIVIGDND